MRYSPPSFNRLKDMASIDVGRLSEGEALAILERLRWPHGVVCPHCDSRKVTRINSSRSKARDGLFQCNGCKGQFTVMVGTVMEGSHITYRQWVQAFHSMCSHKKGVSALQLQRNLGLGSYRSAWYLAHRIRMAMNEGPLAKALKGTVEADETYIGGKPRKGGGGAGAPKTKRGRGTRKTPVLLLVERDGRARSKPVERVNARTLKGAIMGSVHASSRIMTDELASYSGIGASFAGGHATVSHGRGEYSRGENHEINTNTAESYFALLKRGIHGTFHHVSKRHLPLYCDEFSFRWTHRKKSDGEKTEIAIRGIVGKKTISLSPHKH